MSNYTSYHTAQQHRSNANNNSANIYHVVVHDEQEQQQRHAIPTKHDNDHQHYYDHPRSPFSPLSRKLSEKGVLPNGFTRPVAVCFALNYVVGTGFLVLPYVFVQAGLVLSIITVIVASVIADIAKDFVLVSMARAEYVLEHRSNQKPTMVDMLHADEDDDLAPSSASAAASTTAIATTNLETDPLILPAGYEEQEQPCYCSTTAATPSPLGQTPPFTKTPLVRHAYSEPKGRLNNNIRFDLTDGGGIDYASTDDETTTAATGDELETGDGGPTTSLAMPKSAVTRFHHHKKQHEHKPKLLIVKTHRTIELSSLSDIFIGKTGLLLYTSLLSIYMYMMLWAYTSVFAQAMAVSLPLPLPAGNDNDGGSFMDNYTVYVIIFGLIVCPLSFVEVEDQIVVQITLTVLRVVRLLLMIGTSLFCMDCFDHTTQHHPPHDYSGDENISYSYDEEPTEGIPLVRFEGFHILLPVIIAANLMHEAIPDLSEPVQDKTKLTHTFRWTFVCTGLIYSILGASVGLCFGSDVEPSANINWESFHNPNDDDDHGNDWIYNFISLFIICSPALDVISAYPLNAIALGNNLLDVYCGLDQHDSDKSSYTTRMTFRMVSAIPPMIGALFVRDLGIITDYAGVAGLAVTFCITSAMFIGSSRMFERMGVPAASYYDSYGTTSICAHALLWFGIGLVFFVLYGLINETDTI